MRAVLDGHEDFSVIPFESHFFEHLGYWITNPLRNQSFTPRDEESFVEEVKKKIAEYNTKDNPFGDVVLSNAIDEEKFEMALKAGNNHADDKDKIEKYLTAVLKSLRLDEDKRLVEKSVENHEFATLLAKFYPRARFIHIIRNPYSNFVSLRKFNSFNIKGYPRIDRIIETLSSSYRNAWLNQKIIPNYQVVKYEDLLSSPQKEIAKVSDFLGIEFQDTLLKPSLLGEPWGGNSTLKKSLSGITKEQLTKWESDIRPLEKMTVEKHLESAFKIFDYPVIGRRGRSRFEHLAPLKGESIKKYLANRMYLYW